MYYINIYITNSNLKKYDKSRYKIRVNDIIGRGLHGLVVLIKDKVIKIYQKNNIEIEFYNKIINDNIEINNLSCKCAIGYLTKPFIYNNFVFNKNSNILIMPIYNKLSEIRIKIRNEDFILSFIIKIFKLLIYIQQKYNYINLDVKLQNIMYDLKKKDIVLIDFSLILTNSNNKVYIPVKKYKQLPNIVCSLEKIPIYSVYVCIVDLLFENNKKLYNYDFNKIISLLFYKKYSFFFINLLDKIKNMHNMIDLIEDINYYKNKNVNKWYKNLLKDYYYFFKL
jgi:hypothetical protein